MFPNTVSIFKIFIASRSIFICTPVSTIKHVVIYISVCRDLLILQLSDLDLLFFKSSLSYIVIVAATFSVLWFFASLRGSALLLERISVILLKWHRPLLRGAAKIKQCMRFDRLEHRVDLRQLRKSMLRLRRMWKSDISWHIFDNTLPRRCRASWGQASVETTKNSNAITG